MDFPPRPDSGQAARRRRREVEPERPPAAGKSPEHQLERPPRVSERHRPSQGEETKRRRGSGIGETAARVLWALPAIVLAVTIIAIGGQIFAAAMVAFAWIGLSELFRMTSRARPFELVAYAAVAGMIAAAYLGDSFQMVLAGVAFFPVLLAFVLTRESLHNVTWSIAVTVFAIVWIGLPFAHAVLLREIPDHGGALLVDVLVATFLTDTFAYVGGRLFGSRPLAPLISPNKTVEGLLCGIAGGAAGFWFAALYQDWLSGTDALLMGLCIACIAPLGDLFESAIKRDLGVKDSGRVFGPHGGVLDRLDAVLFTVVAGYYLSLAIVL